MTEFNPNEQGRKKLTIERLNDMGFAFKAYKPT